MKITAAPGRIWFCESLSALANCRDEQGMSIPRLSEAEGLSSHYVAKLTRVLRNGGNY